MLDSTAVFDAVRRGYSELKEKSDSDILDYFADMSPSELQGHISNVKGIVFEEVIADHLNSNGLDSSLFELTNHPASDIYIFDDGISLGEVQLKATDSVSYIKDALEANPDIPIITTSEVASSFDDNSMIIDSGLDNSLLTDTVSSVISDNLEVVDSTDVISGAVSDYLSDASSDVLSDSVSDVLSDAVSDTLSDIISPIPLGPIGLIKLAIGLLL